LTFDFPCLCSKKGSAKENYILFVNMNIESLLTEFNKRPISYGMRVELYKMNHQRTRITFDVLDEFNNACMRFQVVERVIDKKTFKKMVLESILYYDYEKKCNISFTKLIEWAKSFVPDVVKYIDLEDASHINIKTDNNTFKVRLRVIRKFFLGESFYEKFKFFPKDKHSRELYDKTFTTLQNIPFDNMCLFIWHLIYPFVINDTLKIREIDNFTRYYDSLNDIIPHNEFYLKQLCTFILTNEMLYAIARNLFVYGFPQHLKRPFSEAHEDFFKKHIKLRKPSSKTLLQIWSPYAKHFMKLPKDTDEDVISFFDMIDTTLYLFEKLNVLFVPFDLRYPNTDNISNISGQKRMRT
tara:strand:- start:8119 stop:9180 length:1062 start_codon:yes stop_codon:yes gene_type:complete